MRIFVALMLMAVTLAGCADDAPPSSAASSEEEAFEGLTTEATETTGAIRGLVLDVAVQVIAGANVTIETLGVETVTNDKGAFVFSKIEAGTYFLTVSKFGYNTTQTTAVVTAGEDKPVVTRITLPENPTQQPYVEPAQFDGFIMCSHRLVVIGYATCSAAGIGDDDFVRNYRPSFRPKWIQSELIWKSTQLFGEELSYSITCISGSPCPNGQLTVARHEGPSPRLLQVNETQAEQFLLGQGQQPITLRVFAHGHSATDIPEEDIYDATGQDCLEWVVLFDGCIRFGGFGMVLEQQFTGYTHMFHNYLPPEDWRFSTQGAPPEP